jgi:hypothetical protein
MPRSSITNLTVKRFIYFVAAIAVKNIYAGDIAIKAAKATFSY